MEWEVQYGHMAVMVRWAQTSDNIVYLPNLFALALFYSINTIVLGEAFGALVSTCSKYETGTTVFDVHKFEWL